MGLFGKLFEKKECAICGGEIGMLGNRKLEDGNMCKNCAAKLSPWFSERKSSTVAEIKEQLAYREENQKVVAAFHTTRTLGRGMKVLLDEDKRQFMITRARNLAEANPDVLNFDQVTGVDFDITENRSEDKRDDKDGKKVSYNPKRFFYSYDFNVKLFVNHPYFNEMRVRLSDSSVKLGDSVPEIRKPDPRMNPDYRELEDMGNEIKAIFLGARQQAREEAIDAAAPKVPIRCPYCGATALPDANGCCEFCGASLKD
ncbi:MAG: DUF4428 domain-containing protein [Lachnospiraceae bacterium]|nr:DUF4428 domain-containing protein [Lachnospiraceae bacterium]